MPPAPESNATLTDRLVVAGLVFAGLVFLGFGVAFMGWPAELFEALGEPLTSPAARTDVRALNGGLQLGVGAYILRAVFYPADRRAALLLGLFCYACLAVGRFVGLVLDGSMSRVSLGLLAAETLGALISGALLVHSGPPPNTPPDGRS